MVEDIPSASFGKPDGATAYQIIHQHPAFETPLAATAFRQICNSFEWRPTNTGLQHRPCFGILRAGRSFLLAEFSDSGRDATGRPNTLRIDCLLATQEQFHDAWKHLTSQATPPSLPDDDELVIVGNPDTFWSSTTP